MAKKAEGGAIDMVALAARMTKLATPVPRKRPPRPGSLLKGTDTIVPGVETLDRGKWVRLPDNSLVMGWTVAYINEIEPAKYRYPLKK